MHPATKNLIRFFAFDHLKSGPMQDTSSACAVLATLMAGSLPDSPEKTAGLRKLLEAKDCFVRCHIPEESD